MIDKSIFIAINVIKCQTTLQLLLCAGLGLWMTAAQRCIREWENILLSDIH